MKIESFTGGRRLEKSQRNMYMACKLQLDE